MFLKKLFGLGSVKPAPIRSAVPAGPPFTERVNTFWQWFSANASRLDSMMLERESSSALVTLVDEAVKGVFPQGIAWCFGPGANGAKHSFVLSPEGNPHRRELIGHWLVLAPEVPGWSFFGSKQPSPDLNQAQIVVEGITFRAKEIWVTPQVDAEAEVFNLWLRHPAFNQKPEIASTVAFIMLDEALGEEVVATRVGGVATDNEMLQNAIPLTELPSTIADEAIRRQWNEREAGQEAVQAKMTQASPPPHDIGEFITWIPDLITEMLAGDLNNHDPLESSGAAYYFIRLSLECDPDKIAPFRDALDDQLWQSGTGKRAGFAWGPEALFYFVTAFDPARALNIMSGVTAQYLENGSAAIYPCSNAYGVGPIAQTSIP